MLAFFVLSSNTVWGQNPDIRLNDRSQIIVPASGSNVQFCSDTGSNLQFQVHNESSGFPNYIDLTSNSLIATLTILNLNTFVPSGTTTVAYFSDSTLSNSASGTTVISAPGYARFDWPTPLQFNSTGSTTIEITVAVSGTLYPDATADNTVTYEINVLSNPNQPVLTTNYGNVSPIDICPGNNVRITASTVGNEYEFYRNGTLLAPKQTSNIFDTTALGDNDAVTVIAYFTNGCGRTSNNIFFNVDPIPAGILSSDAPNDTACEGGDVLFTASGGGVNGWYEFLVNNTIVQASSTISTYSYGPVLTDNVSVTVRTWTSSITNCYDEDTINLRLNSVSGVNEIDNPSTICAGEVPSTILSNQIFVADRAGEGATLSHQWQSRINGGTFADITGATSITFSPSALNTTTYYRRLTYSTFNSVTCASSAASATSNVVTVTVNPNTSASLSVNALNRTICDGDDIIVDASASLNGGSYRFYVNGNPYGAVQNTPTATIVASALTDNATITVRVYYGAGGTGCFSDDDFVLRINEITGSNNIGNAQSVCAGEIPAPFTNTATPTASRAGDGATLAYQWQSRQLGGTFADILGATTLIYNPTAVSTTTEYRRLAVATFNGVDCTTISNVVLLTVTGGAAPTVNMLTGNMDFVHCSTEDIILDASSTTGAQSYVYTLNGVQQAGTPTSTASFTFLAGTISDGDSIGVIAYSGLGGAGCSNSVSETIRINSITGTNTLGGAQTVCAGDDPSILTGAAATPVLGGVISYQWQSRTGTNAFVNITGATNRDYDPPALNLTTDFRRVATATVSGSSCSLTSLSVRVTADPAPTAILNGGTTAACVGDNIVFTASGGTSYEFFLNGVSMAASSTSNTISSTTLNDGEQVTVRVTNAQGCSMLSSATTVNISAIPSAGIISGFAADTICEGEYPVFTATPANNSFTYDFYIDGVLQNLGVNTNTFDTSLTTYTLVDNSVVSVIISNAASCTSSSSVMMRVLSTTGTNSISGTATTVCVGDDPAPITSDATPSAVAAGSSISYQWQSWTYGGSFADIPGATGLNFDPSAISTTTAFRRVAYVSLGGKTCPIASDIETAASNVVTITVNTTALPAISFVSGATNDVMCEGDDLTFDASGTTGANFFQFFVNGISQGPSGTASTLLVTSSMLTDGSTVRVVATSTAASPCSSDFTITMRVNSFTGTNTIGNGQNICENDNPAVLTSIQAPTPALGGANLTYVWQSRTGTNAFADIASTNSPTYDPPVLAEDTDFRRIARSEFNGVICEDISNFITIQVDPAPIATLTGSSTACLGEEVTFSATGGGLYEFFRNNISLAPRSATNNVTTTVNNGDLIKVVVTDTNSCTADSATITMTVTNPPVASISSGLTDNIMCEDDTPIFTAGPAVAGYTYDFYLNSVLQTTGISTNTFDTSALGASLPNNALIEVTVTDANGCSDTASLTMLVNSWSGTNSITGVQTICQGGVPATLSNDQAPTADLASSTIVYQWQSRTGLNPFTDMPGATGQTLTPSVLSTTTAFRRLAYAQINGITCPSSVASAASNIVTVTVDANAAPTVSFSSGFANDTMCDGDAIVFDASGTTGANFYEFFVNGLTQGASSTVATFTPGAALSDGATVTVRAYSGSVSSCFTDRTITMRVIDLTNSNTVSSSQFICENETPAIMTGTAVNANIGTVSYQWQSRTGTNAFIDITGATSQNYSPTTALATSTDFRRLARASFNGLSCDEESNIISISVNPAPVASLIGTNTACVGEEVTFSATGGTAYEFFRNNISLGPISSTNVVTRTDLVNGDQIKVAVTNSNSCTVESSVLTMSVSNPPAASISSGLTGDIMCEGDFPVFTAGPANAGFTYQFLVNGTAQVLGVTTNTFDTAAAGLSLVTTTIITVQVTNADGCTGSASLTLRVNSLDGTNSITGSQTICSGADPVAITNDQVPTADLAGAVISYQWQSRTGLNPFVDIPGANTITYDPSVLVTTTAYRRLVYATFNGVQCTSNVASAASNIVTVTVDANAAPTVSFSSGFANDTMCDGDAIVFDASGTTGANFYEFFVNGLTQGASSTVATFTPGAALSDGATVTVRAYSGSVSSCFTDRTITMRVIDLTNSNTVSSSQFICENETPAIMTGTAVNANIGTVSYQWQSRTGTNAFIDITGATSQNYSPTTALATSTDFRRLARASFNGLSCDEESNIISISVNPAPVASLIGTNTACVGEEVTFSATGGTAYEFFRNNISLGPISSTNVVTRTDLVNGDQIKVAVTNSNSCTVESSVLTMSVSNPPAASISSGLTGDIMCEGDFPVFTAGPANAGFTYQFLVNGTAQVLGVTTNTFDTAAAGLSLVTTTIITVQVTNADGCTGSASLTLRVNSLDGTNSITGSQTICSGADPVAITNDQVPTADLAGAVISYQWQSRTGLNPFVDIPGANTITYDPSVLVTTTAYRRLVYATFNGVQCTSNVASAASNIVTVTVDPNAAPTVSFSSGLVNDVVCDGDSILFDASGSSGATRYEYFINGLSQGASTTVSTFTVAGGTISDGDVVRVVAYSSSSSSCSADRSITIRVNGQTANTLDTAVSSQTICSGDTPSQLFGPSVTGTPTGVVTYQWQSRQGTNTFTNITGATSQTYVFGSPIFTTTGFRRLAINTVNGVQCTTESNVVTVTVGAGPAPTPTLTNNQPASTACAGDNFIFTASGGASYEFFVNGVTQGAPSAATTISLSLNNNDLVRVDVFPAAGGVGCPSQTDIRVNVNTINGNNDIGGIQSICFGDDPAVITSINTPTSATGSITYQWQSRTVSGTFNNITGATSITYDPSNLNVTTLFRRQVISTLNGVACIDNSNTITITVDPVPVITGSLTSDQPSNTVCANDAGAITFTATPTGASSYNFYVNGVSVQASSTTQTYVASITNFDDGDIVLVRFYNASGCFSEQDLTVNVNTSTAGSITGAQTVCAGDAPLLLTSTASATTNGVTATTGDYQWQSSTDAITWNDIIGANAANYQPPASPPPATYYRRQVVSVKNGVSCRVSSNDILVSVNALPVPGLTADGGAVTAAATMSICLGEVVSFVGTGGVEYEFLLNGATAQARSASNTYVTSGLTNSDEITVIAYDSATASACSDVSDAIEVEISAAPVASLSSTAANDTFCIGDAVTFTAGSGGITPAYYEFKVNNFTYQNTTSATFDPADYSIVLSGGEVIEVVVSSLSSCTSVASITMTANGITSVGTITSTTATVCSGDIPAAFIGNTASASGTITYQWQQSLDNITYSDISGATSQNYTPTVALATTTFFRRTAISDLNSVTCEDFSLPFQVVVNPSPVPGLTALPGSLSAPATMNLCEGESATFSGSGGASYEFFVNGTSVAARSTVNTLSLTANATGTLVNNSTVYVRVYDTTTGTACFEDSSVITVFVNPTPTVGITSSNFNNEICTGDSITFTANSTAASPTFEFFVNNVSYQTSSTNTFDPAVYSILIDGGDEIKVEVTTGAASCSSAIASLTVVENAITTVGTITTATPTVCLNDTIPAITGGLASATGAITYQWQQRDQTTSFANIVSANSANYTPTSALVTDTFFRRITISTLPSGFVCQDFSNEISILVDNPPAAILTANVNGSVLTAAATATICSGEEVAFYANAVAGGSYEFYVDSVLVRPRADSNVYSTTALLAGNQVTVRVFDQNTAAAPAGCSEESAAIDILVTAVPTLTVTSTALGNEICEGEAITFFANASIAGATYDFMVNSVSYQNAATQTFDPAAYGLVIGNGDIIEVTASTGVASCSSVTASLTVLTNAITTVGTITVATPTVCLNDTIPAMTGGAGVASGTVSYQWQRRDQTTTVFTNITGATSQNYTPTVGTLLTTDTFFRRLTISSTGTTTCEEAGNTISILVDNPPAAILTANVNGSVLTAAATATICSGEEVAFYANAVAGGSYEFYVDSVLVRPRADSNVYSTTALLAGNQVTVRVFDQNTAAAPAGCSEESAAIDILVTAVPTLTVTSTALGNEICEGEAITFFANASIAGATYDFMVNSVSYQNAATQTFDPAAYGLVIGNGDIIEVTASTGVASCSSVTASLTVLTNAITTVGTITVATPTVCLNDTIPAMTGGAGVASGTVSYQWQRRDQTTMVFTNITGATSQNYTPTVGTLLTTDTFFRRLTISSTGTTTCEEVGNEISILVDNPPAAILTANVNGSVLTAAATATICSGEEVAFYANAVAGGSYEFYVDSVLVRPRADSNVYSTTALLAGNQVTVRVFDQNTAAAPAGCSEESAAIDILVTAVPTLTVTSTALGNEICEGEAITFFANASIAGATYDFMVNSVSYQNAATQTFDPAAYGLVIGNGDIIEVTASTGVASCSSVTASLTVLTNAITTVGTITVATPTVCLNDTIPAMTGGAGVASGTVSYQWQRRDQTTMVFTNITGATSQNYTPTVGTLLTTDTFFRRLTISSTGTTTCEEVGNEISILVDNPPAAILTANVNGSVLTAAATATICSGEEVAFYANAVAGGSYEFYVDSVLVRPRADSNVYSTTALLAGNQVTVRVFDQNTAAAPAGCSEESAAIDILVTAVPTLTVTSTALGNEICEGEAITFFANASIAGATYDFMVNSVSYQNAATQTFDPAAYGLVIGNGDIIEVTASTGVASCSSVTASLTVLTNAITTVGTITVATPTVCLNDTIPAMTGGAGVASGTVSYQWQRRDQTTTVFTNITGATSQNYTPTVGTLLTTDTFFRRLTISSTGTTTCEEVGNEISILVDNPPAAILTANVNGSVLTAAATATICSGEEVAFYANAVAGGSYEFYVDSVLVRPRADSNVYSTTALLAGNQVTVRVFDQNTAAAPAGCSEESAAIDILVTAVPTLTVTSTALGNEICEGEAITFFANASIAGATYDFMVNSVSYQNAATQTFDPAAYGLVIGNGDIIEVTASTGVASCSSVTASLTVLTNAITTVGTITVATPTVCLNDTIPAMTGGAGVASGTVSYQWQRRDQTTTVFTNITGATSQNYTPTVGTLLTTDTFFRRLTISSTGTTTCEEVGNEISILVDNPPAAILTANVNGSVLTAAATATICSGEEVAFYANAVAGGSYEFYVDSVLVRPRADSNVYSTTALLAGNQVTVRVFDQNTAAAPAGCSEESAAIDILVTAVPTLTVTSTALGNEICEGEAITFFANASIAGATYDFMVNSVSYQNAATQTFDPAAYGLVIGNGDIIEVTASTGVASCSSVTASLTVLTNAITTVGTITVATPTVCLNDTIPAMTGGAGVASGTVSYQWQRRDQTTMVFTNITGATSQNYTPTVGTLLTTDTFFRRLTISSTGTTTCEEVGNEISILVDNPPAAILTANVNGSVLTAAATATICSGEEVAFYANAVAGGSYEFYVDSVLVRPRADSNVYSTTALLAGNQVTVRVFDQNTAAAPAGCSEESAAIDILITAVPTLTVTSTALGNEICEGEAITFFANASIAGATYDFMVNSVSYQNAATQTFDPAAYGLVIGNGDIIEVTASTGVASCSSVTASLTVLTNAITTVGTITVATPTVCLNDTIPAMTGGAGVASGTVSYQWQRRNQTTMVFTNITGATSQNYTPTVGTLLTTDTFFRRLTISSTGTTTCEEVGNEISILVDNPPAAILTANVNGSVLTAAATATICSGEEVAFYANAVAGGSYEFYVDSVLVRPRADSNVYSTTALLAGNQVTVRVFDQNTAAAPAGCSEESAAIDILVTAVPTLTVTSTALGNEICEGEAITFFANASIAGATYDFMVNSVSYQNAATQTFDPAAYGLVIGNGDIIEVTASTGVASCSSVTASLTVLTNAITTVGTITVATPTVCLNDTIPAMTGGAGVASGTVSYQWQRRDQTTTVFTNITGATSQNYTPTVGTLLTTDTFFRRLTISSTGTTTCEEVGNEISILVDNPPAAILTANVNGSVLTAAATATICSGEEVAFYANAVAGGSYEFYVDSVLVRPRADSNVYSTTALLAGNQVTVRVFDQNTAAAPAGCSEESAAIDILVTAVPTLTVTSTALGNEICEGEAITFFANASIPEQIIFLD